MNGLTQRQRAVYEAIRDLTKDGVPPTYRELQMHLGLASASQVARMIDCLERRGFVSRRCGEARSLHLTADGEILARPTPDLRWLRDQIDRELRRRSF